MLAILGGNFHFSGEEMFYDMNILIFEVWLSVLIKGDEEGKSCENKGRSI